ncbi:MAG: ABC transporter ATP-binding protein/permease [Lachnospiraceae bacterium]|nr:ABC transporter ATP-binding protein/permease [Lachnospiraceae bacterium]
MVTGKKQKFWWQAAWKHSWLLLSYMALAFLLNQIIIYGNDTIAKAADQVLGGHQIALAGLLKALAVLAFAGAAAAFGKSFCSGVYNAVIQRDIKNRLCQHILGLRMGYFEKNGSGGLMTRLSSDMNEIGRFFTEIMPTLLVDLITVLTITFYFVKMDVMLIVILFASYPLMLIVADRLSKRLATIARGFRSRMDDRTQAAYDAIQGITVGRSYNLYPVMKKRLDTIIDDIAMHGWKSTRISSLGWLLKGTITNIPVIGCYFFALNETLNGRITTGEMLAFTVLLGRILTPIGDIVFCLNDVREAGVAFERVQKIFEEPAEACEADGVLGNNALEDRLVRNDLAICWKDVTFSYQPEHPVLRGVSFAAKKGETIAFVGGSGEGKSTVMKLLCGFYQKDGGSFLLYGKAYEEWDIQAARACFSLVSQDVFLFPVSVWENVAYGKEGATKEEVVAACKNANIHAFIVQLPQGYDSLVGERGVRLSGGERQRISIARAFLKDAPILLLDEPTAAVDEETEGMLQEALARISKGRTVLIVAHRLSTIVNADCIYVIEQGRVAESGRHEALLARHGAYERLMQCGAHDLVHNEGESK